MGSNGERFSLVVADDSSGEPGGTGGVPWYYGYTWLGQIPQTRLTHMVFLSQTSYRDAAADGVRPGVPATAMARPGGVVLSIGRGVYAADPAWTGVLTMHGSGALECPALVIGERWRNEVRTEVHVLLHSPEPRFALDQLPAATTLFLPRDEQPTPRSTMSAGPAAPLVLWGLDDDGYFPQEVVGESHYKKHLDRLTKGKQPPIYVDACLRHERENRHDSNAVVVEIKGRTVGYLPRSVAGGYAPVLDGLATRGYRVEVPAQLSWWAEGTDDVAPGVWLNLGPAEWLVPANEPPGGDNLVMPWSMPGVRCNDVDTQQVEQLAAGLGRRFGRFAAYGVIDIVKEGSRKERAHIIVDGRHIATATPQSSAHLVPLRAAAALRGQGLVAPVAISCLPGQSEVTVACRRAKDMPVAWFNADTAPTD